MDARSIIMAVRDGRGLAPEAAAWFATGLASGAVSDAQAGAFAMAVLCRGIGDAGRVALTQAMRDSGQVLAWDLPGPVVDKHSTGGIGDSVSLVLAPALAACGVYVPMISGRGLGHTGGTLDKMEAIPGYRTLPGIDVLRKVVAEVGCAIVGATDEIAPADKRLYGIRDISGTVESIDLITASILSKKLAAGLDALVLDVKVGSGAFMATVEDAQALAESLVRTANDAGCRTSALMTDMNSPLGRSAGNALEVLDAIEILTGPVMPDLRPLREVTEALGGEVLMLAGMAESAEDGAKRIHSVICSGHAAERFAKMVAALGGPVDFLEKPRSYLPEAYGEAWDEPSFRKGNFVKSIDTRALGELVVRLGGGRLRGDDAIDHAVGLRSLSRVGDELHDDIPVGVVDAKTQEEAEALFPELQRAYTLSTEPVAPDPLILARIGPEDVA